MNSYPQSKSVVTGPASEPITVAEAKTHCRVEISDDDTYIGALIQVARETAEVYTGRALMTQTLDVKYAAFPEDGSFWFPAPPLQSVTSVKYYDTDGTQRTLSTDVYEVDTAHLPGRIALKPNQVWPDVQTEKNNPITIRGVSGFADAASVPAGIKHGMLLLIGMWYEQRADEGDVRTKPISIGAKALFAHNVVEWGY